MSHNTIENHLIIIGGFKAIKLMFSLSNKCQKKWFESQVTLFSPENMFNSLGPVSNEINNQIAFSLWNYRKKQDSSKQHFKYLKLPNMLEIIYVQWTMSKYPVIDCLKIGGLFTELLTKQNYSCNRMRRYL